jgi:hypothetical protein
MLTLPTIEQVAETRWKLILLLNTRLGQFLDLRRKLQALFDPKNEQMKSLSPEEKLDIVKQALNQIS